MAELISGAVKKVVEKVGSWIYGEITSAWGFRNDLEELKSTMAIVRDLIVDVDEEMQCHDPTISPWRRQLRDVFHDAEDVIDEFEIETLRRKVVQQSIFKRKAIHFFSRSNPLPLRFKMAHKLKKIRGKLNEISKTGDGFQLVQPGESTNSVHKERGMTYSFVRSIDIIGREKDKGNILDNLTLNNNESISVLPITGLGGLGKTALAKLVFNDERVTQCFEPRVWVCVSDDFDVKRLVTKILVSFSYQVHGNMEMEQLQRDLRAYLDGKRYLLVLDDVWEEDPRKWLELKSLLMGGASGSQILVTTRSDRVASIMGTSDRPYKLDHLSHEDCLELFFKCSSQMWKGKEYPNLRKIGEDLVRKCKGVPLAIITLGTLSSSTTEEREWKSVRDSDIWRLEQKENDILPALKLSYEKLSSPLKRCFAYCSIFPKDYVFGKLSLLLFWMAHGLLQPSNSSDGLKEELDIGYRYFNELASRGFFQDIEENSFGLVTFKMHDLIHDLALLVSQNECLTITSSNIQNLVPNGVRHLSIADTKSVGQDINSWSNHLEHVRTFFFKNASFDAIPENTLFVRNCILMCKCLRVLNLRRSGVEELPKEIGDLKHLRYLDLYGNFRLKMLPDSICKLQYLETLLLGGCSNLEELPKDIKYLVSLKVLTVTTKQRRFPNDGIGSLKSLCQLWIYNCENLEFLFEDMQGLTNLRTLFISLSPHLKSLPGSIKNLKALERLRISWCYNLTFEEGESNIDNAQFSLRELEMAGLFKVVGFPQWLIQGSANTLERLKIRDCPELNESTIPLKNLTSLKDGRVNGRLLDHYLEIEARP